MVHGRNETLESTLSQRLTMVLLTSLAEKICLEYVAFHLSILRPARLAGCLQAPSPTSKSKATT
jgi:hypothetical protein